MYKQNIFLEWFYYTMNFPGMQLLCELRGTCTLSSWKNHFTNNSTTHCIGVVKVTHCQPAPIAVVLMEGAPASGAGI